jgi:enoyl-[acyl-carrier-protein] reductase (NADH)
VQARAASRHTTGLAGRHLFGPAEPTDVAQMAVYLASDQSRMVTGHVLPVDSGVTIH